jgi:hypothetical protein
MGKNIFLSILCEMINFFFFLNKNHNFFFFLNKKQKSCVFSSLCGGAAWSDRRHAPAQPQDKEIWSNITFPYFNKFIFVYSLFFFS